MFKQYLLHLHISFAMGLKQHWAAVTRLSFRLNEKDNYSEILNFKALLSVTAELCSLPSPLGPSIGTYCGTSKSAMPTA